MSNIVLKRISHSSRGVHGVLLRDGDPLCLTLECPWLDNIPFISCIPAGSYPTILRHSPRFNGPRFALSNVPDRSNILIHEGNSTMDTSGCILAGQGYDSRGIINSRKAIEMLRTTLPLSFNLTILEV